MKLRVGDAGTAIFAFAGYWVFVIVDVVLARHYLPRGESGFYGAGATAEVFAVGGQVGGSRHGGRSVVV